MAERKLPGIIVCHGDGSPHTILPGSQVLRFVIPRYVQDDEALARVIDEQAADDMSAELAGKRVRASPYAAGSPAPRATGLHRPPSSPRRAEVPVVARYDADLAVIGAGSAGLTAARLAARGLVRQAGSAHRQAAPWRGRPALRRRAKQGADQGLAGGPRVAHRRSLGT